MPSTSFAPLRQRGFRRMWLGALVSNVGTWMETVALGRYVAETTGKAVWTGVLAAAGFLPTAVVGLVGGALADRASRKRMMINGSLAQAVIAAVVTVLVTADRATPTGLSLLALLSGCAGAIAFPAFQSAIPDLVSPDDLPAAIGLGSVQWNLGRVLGPVLAGLAISLGSIGTALAINTASFFAVVIAVAPIAIPQRPAAPDRPPVLRTIADGWRIVRTEPGLRVMNAAMCVNTLIAAPFIALIPAMVEKVLHAGRSANSVLVTAQGVGAVAAGLAIGPLVTRFGVRRVMVGALTTTAFALVAYGAAPGLWLMAPALAVVGGCYMTSLSSFSTIGQTRSPAEYRGRVMAINNAVLGLLYPIGAVAQGALGDRVGLRLVTIGSGLALAVALAVAAVALPRAAHSLDTPPTGASLLDAGRESLR